MSADNPKLVASKSIGLPTGVLAVAAHPDGQQLFAACLDRGVWAVPLAGGAPRKLYRHDSYASGVQCLPRLNQIVSAGYDGSLRWWDLAADKPVRTVQAHRFWSWKMRVSPDQKLLASVTGQYLAGGEKYEPAPEREPSVRVYDAETGALRLSLPHVPPTLSVAFAPDSKHVAAANLMGEVRVWEIESGKQVATWTTPDFTCWGIIKSHHYIGGIFDLAFTADGRELLACGMGPMEDPMAGNGKQTWQRFAWGENPPRKVGQILDGDAGGGLMESLRVHPDAKFFVMSGKLAQGKWNAALFETESGKLVHAIDTKLRIADATWLPDGKRVVFAGGTGQPPKTKDGKYPDFGHLKLYTLE